MTDVIKMIVSGVLRRGVGERNRCGRRRQVEDRTDVMFCLIYLLFDLIYLFIATLLSCTT